MVVVVVDFVTLQLSDVTPVTLVLPPPDVSPLQTKCVVLVTKYTLLQLTLSAHILWH